MIYIDDSALVPGARDQTEAIRDIISEQGGEEAGLHFISLKLEDVFGHEGGMEVVDCLVGPAGKWTCEAKDRGNKAQSLIIDLLHISRFDRITAPPWQQQLRPKQP